MFRVLGSYEVLGKHTKPLNSLLLWREAIRVRKLYYSTLTYSYQLQIFYCAWSSLTANRSSLMESSLGFHGHWFSLQTAFLLVVIVVISVLFVATAISALQPLYNYPAVSPSRPLPLPPLYCHAPTTPLPRARISYAPPFCSQAHIRCHTVHYFKLLMLSFDFSYHSTEHSRLFF